MLQQNAQVWTWLEREEITGGYRKQQNEELHKSTLHKILLGQSKSQTGCAGHVACIGEMRNACKI
jgi:hypothetical protein